MRRQLKKIFENHIFRAIASLTYVSIWWHNELTNFTAAQSPVKGYNYDEFGKKTDSGEEDFLNEVTFTGSVSDTSTGLQYMNARYYNPSTGRFLTQDSCSGNAYDPWTQHLYSYCGNNPVNMIDPTGHSPSAIGSSYKFVNGKSVLVGVTSRDKYTGKIVSRAASKEEVSVDTRARKGSTTSRDRFTGQLVDKKTGTQIGNKTDKSKGFSDPDNAALDFLMQNQEKSQSENREHGAVIYQNNNTGTNNVGAAYVGDEGSVLPIGFESIVNTFIRNDVLSVLGLQVSGTVHTHQQVYNTSNDPALDTYNCQFSDATGFPWLHDNILPGIRYLGAGNGVMYKSVNFEPTTVFNRDLPKALSYYNYPEILNSKYAN